MKLTPIDHDALTRAIAWCETYQRSKSIVLVKHPLPRVGSPAWFEAARYCASFAQRMTLRLKPWDCWPCATADKVSDPPRYAHRPHEVELRQRMIRLGVSIFEADPLRALAEAEAARPSPAA